MAKKKIKENTAKNLFRTEINIALGGIPHLEARLHRLIVTGEYKYSQCVKHLGKMYKDTKTFLELVFDNAYSEDMFDELSPLEQVEFIDNEKDDYKYLNKALHLNGTQPIRNIL